MTLCCKVQYSPNMAKQQVLQIRLDEREKAAFLTAAELAGIPLSSWVRERLRFSAIRDLEGAGLRPEFVEDLAIAKEARRG